MKHTIISSKFWFILGIIFILCDPLLAHLCNANIIKWPAAWDTPKTTDLISHLLVGGGIIFLIIAYVRSRYERKIS